MATKKRSVSDGRAAPAGPRARKASDAPARKAAPGRSRSAAGGARATTPRAAAPKPRARSAAGGATARPKLHASHATAAEVAAPRGRATAAGAARKPGPSPRKPLATRRPEAADPSPAAGPAARTPLAGPKRAGPRRPAPGGSPVEPSAAARELALAIAEAGMDKKAIGIEILDVSGRVDYADFLVIMTGRSDRHVHSIAMGLEEALRKRKTQPASMEGLSASTWVLIDFGDVVVHVFQEEARLLYDIEGLWIDARRVPVPEGAPEGGAGAQPGGAGTADASGPKAPPRDLS